MSKKTYFIDIFRLDRRYISPAKYPNLRKTLGFAGLMLFVALTMLNLLPEL